MSVVEDLRGRAASLQAETDRLIGIAEDAEAQAQRARKKAQECTLLAAESLTAARILEIAGLKVEMHGPIEP